MNARRTPRRLVTLLALAGVAALALPATAQASIWEYQGPAAEGGYVYMNVCTGQTVTSSQSPNSGPIIGQPRAL